MLPDPRSEINSNVRKARSWALYPALSPVSLLGDVHPYVPDYQLLVNNRAHHGPRTEGTVNTRFTVGCASRVCFPHSWQLLLPP